MGTHLPEQVKTDSKTDTNISDEELLQQPDAENSLDKVSDVITDEDRSNTNTEA